MWVENKAIFMTLENILQVNKSVNFSPSANILSRITGNRQFLKVKLRRFPLDIIKMCLYHGHPWAGKKEIFGGWCDEACPYSHFSWMSMACVYTIHINKALCLHYSDFVLQYFYSIQYWEIQINLNNHFITKWLNFTRKGDLCRELFGYAYNIRYCNLQVPLDRWTHSHKVMGDE